LRGGAFEDEAEIGGVFSAHGWGDRRLGGRSEGGSGDEIAGGGVTQIGHEIPEGCLLPSST